MAKIFCLLALCCLAGACGSGNEKKQTTASKNFQMIEVPSILDNPGRPGRIHRQKLLAEFRFHGYLADRQTGNNGTGFCRLRPHHRTHERRNRRRINQNHAVESGSGYGNVRPFLDLFEKYLYDPNSPMRNETLYITVLRVAIGSPKTSEAEKTRMRYRLDLAQRNRPEMPATDFAYTLASGKTGTLYDIDAEYLILFFNNPGCHACQRDDRPDQRFGNGS